MSWSKAEDQELTALKKQESPRLTYRQIGARLNPPRGKEAVANQARVLGLTKQAKLAGPKPPIDAEDDHTANIVANIKFLARLQEHHPKRAPRHAPTQEAVLEAEPIAAPEYFDPVDPPVIPLRTILLLVADFYGYTTIDLRSCRRDDPLVRARFVYYHLAKKHTLCSLYSIGKAINKPDHKTVKHGLQSLGSKIKSNERLADEIELLSMKLRERVAA